MAETMLHFEVGVLMRKNVLIGLVADSEPTSREKTRKASGPESARPV
jgi:hypothetical protein